MANIILYLVRKFFNIFVKIIALTKLGLKKTLEKKVYTVREEYGVCKKGSSIKLEAALTQTEKEISGQL